MIFKVIDIPNVSLALLHWNTFKFVDEVSARTHEKVVLQHPGIKKIMLMYYIKVSGIASGNKLIKTIRYPHM